MASMGESPQGGREALVSFSALVSGVSIGSVTPSELRALPQDEVQPGYEDRAE